MRIETDPAHLVVGDASTATFAFTWAGSGRTNQPWSRAQMECRARPTAAHVCDDAILTAPSESCMQAM